MFKGLGGLGNLGEIANLMKEAGKIKERFEALKCDLSSRICEGAAGGGMVKAKVNGRQEIVSIEIDSEVFGGGDKALLQDLVIAACNAALDSSREMMKQELAKITGGLNLDIPGIM
jgi:nucleoid-associated protein EbfC